jgi:hypothetical protein
MLFLIKISEDNLLGDFYCIPKTPGSARGSKKL